MLHAPGPTHPNLTSNLQPPGSSMPSTTVRHNKMAISCLNRAYGNKFEAGFEHNNLRVVCPFLQLHSLTTMIITIPLFLPFHWQCTEPCLCPHQTLLSLLKTVALSCTSKQHNVLMHTNSVLALDKPSMPVMMPKWAICAQGHMLVHLSGVTFLDYLYAFHTQTYSDCSFIFRS